MITIIMNILIDPDNRGVIWTNLNKTCTLYQYNMMFHINNSTNFTPTILLKKRYRPFPNLKANFDNEDYF